MLVTGAAGYLGRAVLDAAREEGTPVRPATRRDADLRADDLGPLLDGVDVVVHLAAAKGGDFHAQYAATVRGTDRLLDAAVAAGVRRFVLCSSFAVYDYDAPRPGALVDEGAPLAVEADHRDAYAQTKVLQEELVRRRCAEAGIELVVLRPGVVCGDGSWWTYRVGERFGRLWLALGSGSQVPLVHVEDCARALVLAATAPGMAGGTYDVLVGDPPSQAEYRRALAASEATRPLVLVVPWPLARAGAALASGLAARSGGQWRLPGFLVPSSLAVRAKPLRFSSARLAAAGWTPRHPWSGRLQQELRQR